MMTEDDSAPQPCPDASKIDSKFGKMKEVLTEN